MADQVTAFMAYITERYPLSAPALSTAIELKDARIAALETESRAQAATLATVTPLVQQLVDGLEHHMLQTRPITVTEILLAEARAFLSGATKESTDHGLR